MQMVFLRNVRTDRTETAVPRYLPLNAFTFYNIIINYMYLLMNQIIQEQQEIQLDLENSD